MRGRVCVLSQCNELLLGKLLTKNSCNVNITHILSNLSVTRFRGIALNLTAQMLSHAGSEHN